MRDAGFDMYADYKVARIKSGAVNGCVVLCPRIEIYCTANILDQTQAPYVALALHCKASKSYSDDNVHV